MGAMYFLFKNKKGSVWWRICYWIRLSKDVDRNSYWFIRKNPITQEGVFPYSGKMIGDPSLEPNKLYNVYRPLEELIKAKDTFEGVPFIDGHEMIGAGGTPYDKRAAQGFLSNIVSEGKKIYGDLKIWSESLKKKIEQGVKELSLGYRCIYEPAKGVFNGKPYDFIQRNLVGNHLALVPEGRMGSDVKVYDSMTFDSIEIEQGENMEETEDEFISIQDFKKKYNKPEDLAWVEQVSYKRSKEKAKDESEVQKTEKSKTGFIVKKVNNGEHMEQENKVDKKTGDEGVDKRKLIDEIGGILKSVKEGKEEMSDELIRTVLGKAEELSYNGSERSESDDEEEKKDKSDEKGKDEDEEEVKKVKKEKEEEEEETKAMDAAEIKRNVLKTIREMDKLYKSVSPYTGEFAYDELENEDAMATVACRKLGIATNGNARATLNGFLAARKDVRFSLDSRENRATAIDIAQARLDSILK